MNEDILNKSGVSEDRPFILRGDIITDFDFPKEQASIIKVIGVGGGGGNAVTHMYKEGIHDVSFVLCNTDRQALDNSDVPAKVQLGKKGLGAGNNPLVAKQAAEESIADIKKMLNDETEMVFITAGMGGGTGTGAAPVVARVAKEMGILTVGIVTIPFLLEGIDKILQALKGVEEIEKNVDALLVINNERLLDIYSNLTLEEGFIKADDTLTIAAKSIAEIITIPGIINVDFADVNTTLKEGGVAIMSSGLGKGESRVSAAIENALNSPLLNNNDIIKAKKILLNISFSSTHPLMMEEMKEVHRFMAKFSSGIKVIWGTAKEEKLDENVKITILATGFGIENISLDKEVLEAHASISDIEAIKAREEEERRKEEEERKRLIMKYYPGETAISILRGTSIRPKPFIFTFENIDDNETIEALINHPTYNRSTQVMFDIAKKAEARRADYVEEVKGETEDNKTEEEKQETIFNF